MADRVDEFDFWGMPMPARRALARAQQAETGNTRMLARAMQMSGDPVFTGVGNAMDTEAALADQSLQQAAHGVIGHEVQAAALESETQHRLAQEAQAKAQLDALTDYHNKKIGIDQQNADTRALRGGATGQARALAATEKFGKPGNIPGIIAQLVPVAQMDRLQVARAKAQSSLGLSEDPTMTWNTFSEGLLQEMGNVSHGSASESAVEGFRRSRPDALTSSPVKKMQWLREVSQWGYHQSEQVNAVARNAGFPMGVVPEEVMQGWQAVHAQLFPQAPPLSTSTPVQAPPGPRMLARPPVGPPPGPAPQPTASGGPPGAPPAGPPGPTASPPPGQPPPGPQTPPPGPPAQTPPPRIDLPPGTMVRVQLPKHPPSRPVPVEDAQRFLIDNPKAVILPGDG